MKRPKKKVGQKHNKERISVFCLAHFVKKKKRKAFLIVVLSNVCETNLFFCFVFGFLFLFLFFFFCLFVCLFFCLTTWEDIIGLNINN